jgi:hypothetical protein
MAYLFKRLWKGNAISNQLAEPPGLFGICALPALRHKEAPYPRRISEQTLDNTDT